MNSKIKRKEISSAVEFVIKEVKNFAIYDNFPLKVIRNVNLYLNEEKSKQWTDKKVELDTQDR